MEAQSVIATFDIDSAAGLEIGELMVRYRLMLTTGQITDAARTDPQTHHVGAAKEESEPWDKTPSTF